MTVSDENDLPRMTRRAALRGAGALAAAGTLSALLPAGAAASGSLGSMTGTLTLLTYPEWYGPHEFAEFEKLHPGLTIKTAVSGTTGAAAQIAQISTNPGAFDITLAGVPVSSQMKLAGILEPLDTALIPNLSRVGETFRSAFPFGIPTDFGKTGFGYRADLVSERPTSWHDLFSLAEKYSGKITMIKYDSDVQGSFLRALGYSINTKVQSQLQAMQSKMLSFKPHLQAILETDYSKALIEGTALFAIDYDYDIAAAQQQNKHIVWVPPSEGMSAYLEGWIGLKGSKHLGAVWDLMNFHLEPKNYASFVNATGTAFVEQAAVPYIEKSIAANPSLRYDPSTLRTVEFEQYLGPEQTAYRGRLWEEFLAA
jgi:spermidine/putrescine transport system substrate-binding protein